jgi:protein tyrosine phosphatase (PTP) superfamily phosphohydrolase (DUF442 family)
MRYTSPILILIASIAFPLAAHAADPLVAGVPNFHRVNDHIMRGGQPSDQGWSSLARLGVGTVIDLRRVTEHSTVRESVAVVAAGMRYVNVPMNGFVTPRADQIDRILGLLDRGDTVFIHCKLGKDRTGTVIAAYRVEHDRWANAKAMDEAKSCGLHWYEFEMKSYINRYSTRGPALALAGGDSTRSHETAEASLPAASSPTGVSAPR